MLGFFSCQWVRLPRPLSDPQALLSLVYLEAPPAPPSLGVGQSLTPNSGKSLLQAFLAVKETGGVGERRGLFLARASQGKVQEAEKLNQIPAEDVVPLMGQMAMC